jgi:ribosomal protein S12 methylthiotransferase
VILQSTLPRVAFISLGCPKNLVDSEVLLGNLAQDGFVLSGDPNSADIVIVNTCSFIDAAEVESYQAIEDALHWKREGRIKAVVVAGCMASRYREQILEKLPEIDGFLGVFDRESISDLCQRVAADNAEELKSQTGPIFRVTDPDIPAPDTGRLRLTPRHYAYLKISEGCNHTCAFCVIPKIRGKFRSKPASSILEEAREMAGDGAKELILVAQDTTCYGLDTHRRRMLPDLLEQLADVDGVEWIRLMYMYPTLVNDAILDAMADNPKVIPYIDMPLQHMDHDMLRMMRRGMTERGQVELVQRMREKIPGLMMRTAMIVGFPGETEAQFETLCDYVREVRWERLGAFTFSREVNTAAYTMDGLIPPEEMIRRRDRVMEIQREIVLEQNQARVGSDIEIIVDGPSEREDADWIGRTYGDAPDVDCNMFISGPAEPGQIRKATVTGFDEYDLMGTLGAE